MDEDLIVETVRYTHGESNAAGTVVHGIHELPDTWIPELEIGWVADQLARDAYAELTLDPSDPCDGREPDPTWWPRYPGW